MGGNIESTANESQAAREYIPRPRIPAFLRGIAVGSNAAYHVHLHAHWLEEAPMKVSIADGQIAAIG